MTEKDPADLSALDAKLKAARERNRIPEPGAAQPSRDSSGMATGLRLSMELIAGILVGLGMGWALDKWLGTKPWCLVIFLLLGFSAGLLNVIRIGKQLDQQDDAATKKD